MELVLEYWNGSARTPVPGSANFGHSTAETASNVAALPTSFGGVWLSAARYTPTNLWSLLVPPYISDFNFSGWIVVTNGTVANLTRPPVVELHNAMRLRYLGRNIADAVFKVTRPIAIVHRWQREYLIRVVGPVERVEWAPEGRCMSKTRRLS